VDMQLVRIIEADYLTVPVEDTALGDIKNEAQLISAITQMETEMRAAAKNFEFERAASLRDKIRSLKQRDLGEIFAPADMLPENTTQTSGSAANATTVNLPLQQTPPAKRGDARAKASRKS
jgi:UvrB/uvrC motif